MNLNKVKEIPKTNGEYFIDYYGTVYHKLLTGQYTKTKPRVKKGVHKVTLAVRGKKKTERRIDKILDETFGTDSANLFSNDNRQIKKSLYSSEVVDIIKMYESGTPVKAIATEYGISVNTVRFHINRRLNGN